MPNGGGDAAGCTARAGPGCGAKGPPGTATAPGAEIGLKRGSGCPLAAEVEAGQSRVQLCDTSLGLGKALRV